MNPPDDAHAHVLRPDALDGPRFQRALLEGLAALEGVRAGSAGPFRIAAARGEREMTVRLDGVYKRYRHGETELGDVLEEIKAALGVPGAAVVPAGPFPRLQRRDALPPGAFHAPCPFDETLAVTFVHELPHGHVALTPADVAAGWTDPGDLAREATDALRSRTREVPAEGRGEGDRQVLGYASGDGFDAARILLPDLIGSMAEWLPGRVRVAVPSRDLLMAVGDSDPDFLAEATEHIRQTYAADPEPVSPRWYTLEDGWILPA